jgi:hypothetical protein
MNALRDYINADTLSDSYAFTASGLYTSPPDGDYESYVDWIRNLPINAFPEVFGLHENADITCARDETFATLRTLLSLQARPPTQLHLPAGTSAGSQKTSIKHTSLSPRFRTVSWPSPD